MIRQSRKMVAPPAGLDVKPNGVVVGVKNRSKAKSSKGAKNNG